MSVETDLLGYAAAVAVLVTFALREMFALRFMAIVSNVLFVCYAYRAGLAPILVLHILLLPLNVLRLRQSLNAMHRRPAGKP